MDLKEGTLYLIRYKLDKKRIFTGTFKFCTKDKWSNKMNADFTNVMNNSSKETIDEVSIYNYTDYHYYDAEKVKSAKQAIENMEKRALNQILKRLVNEHFEWL
jgi:hypothetical protein